MAILWGIPDLRKGMVGHVKVTITVTNAADLVRAESGIITADQVRTVTVDDVIVDTGATLLGLPADIIAQLGLPFRRNVVARTAAGQRQTRRFSGVEITILGRSQIVECTELPVGVPCLLGVTVMETMGLQPDVQNHTLRLLPEGPDETYILEY